MKHIHRLVTPWLVVALLLIGALSGAQVLAQQPEIPAEQLLLRHDFDAPQRFLQMQEEGFGLAYVNGAYQIRNSMANAFVSSALGVTYTDHGVFADARLADGPETGYFGAVCRLQDEFNYYGFVVGQNGFFGIVRVLNNELVFLTQAQEPDVIRPATEINRVGGICEGNLLTLVVNGEALLEIQDNTFASGNAGVMVGTRAEAGVVAQFDTFMVTTTEAAPAPPPVTEPAPEPPVSEPVEPAPTPPATVLFEHDFTPPARFWQTEQPGFSLAYVNGAYRVRNNFINSFVSSALPGTYTDSGVFADARFVSGPTTGYYGTVCRLQDAFNYYAFVIGHDGSFGIARVQNGVVTFLSESREGIGIRPATEINQVGGICQGNTLTMVVNGQSQVQVQDNTFASGTTGVMVLTRGQPGVLVEYQNFMATTPEAPPEAPPVTQPVTPAPVPVEAQSLVGAAGGAHHDYTVTYPAETEVMVSMSYWPSDPSYATGIGFNIWSNGHRVAEGERTEFGNILEATFVAEANAEYVIQVFNYIDGRSISYELTTSP